MYYLIRKLLFTALCLLLLPISSLADSDTTQIPEATASLHLLTADSAFKLTAQHKNDGSIMLHWRIAPGYQLYQDSIKVQNAKVQHWPLPLDFVDALGQAHKAYDTDISLALSKLQDSHKPLRVDFQGCHGTDQCYPPMSQQFSRLTNTSWTQADSQLEHPTGLAGMSVLGFFVAGLLLAFTPCVLPMLPILAAMLFGSEALSTGKRLTMALSYVLSMAVTYAATGVLAASLGHTLQASMQIPVVIYGFAALLSVMGLLMMSETSPRWLNANLMPRINSQRWYTPILLGITATLITSPCVTPAFLGGLSYIASTGNKLLGATGLFALALGMGIPLLLVAVLGTQVLPKSGAWGDKIKKASGVMLIVTALWLVSRIAQPMTLGMLISASIIICALALGKIKSKLMVAASTSALAICSLVVMQGYLPHGGASVSQIARVSSLAQLEPLLRQTQGQPVILNFTASWCASCKQLDRDIFTNDLALQALSGSVIIDVDISKQNAATQSLMRAYNVYAPPTIVIIKDGINPQYLSGAIEIAQLLRAIG
jgi:thioredoxin:protein disulfide reductase